MNQLVQNQNLYPDPFSYFANRPQSIHRRKHKALKLSLMKIIFFLKNDDGSFIVYLKGERYMIYMVSFSERAITCSCPDYQKHSVKPICKHMFKCISLSENDDIFNNVMLLSELMVPQYLGPILNNIIRIVDIKKMERYGNPQNQISIERDDCCSICYGDFDTDIAKCSNCKHVFHQNCVRLSWNSAMYNAKGKCPMCRELNSFPELGGNQNNDPWAMYDFTFHSQLPEPEPVQEPVPEPVLIGNPQFGIEEQDPELLVVQQDILVVNPGGNLLDNPIVPAEQEHEQNDEVFVQNELIFPVIDDIPEISFENSEDENSNPNSNSNLNSEEFAPSLSQEEEYDIVDTRTKILNISLFILNTINIIINHISSDLSLDPNTE